VECNYTEVAWNLVPAAMTLPNYASMAAAGGPNQWIQVLNKVGSKKERKKNVGILCIFCG
jgi:hypothetical protein